MPSEDVTRAAVLCPGPSLAEMWAKADKQQYELTLAVNRAAAHWPCTHLCFQDWWTWKMLAGTPLGKPVLISDPGTYQRTKNRYHDSVRRYEFLPQERPDWVRFTANVAIWMAHTLGATIIDVYGMDLAGVNDWDGFTDSKQIRHDNRWTRERRIFIKLAAFLAENHATAVKRILPEKSFSEKSEIGG